MGKLENMSGKDGMEQLKKLVEDIRVCMFCTNASGKIPLQTRPMSTQEIDENGNIWFFSDDNSDKNLEIRNDHVVQLIYAKPSNLEFLSVVGTASVIKDRDKIGKMWNKMAEAWFKGGKDDPSLSLIKVKPSEIYYWDTQHNKMVSLLKIAVSAFSGLRADDGVEGNIEL
jgi:general stress protein 26